MDCAPEEWRANAMLNRIRLTCGTLFDGKDNISSIDSIKMFDQFPNGQAGETNF